MNIAPSLRSASCLRFTKCIAVREEFVYQIRVRAGPRATKIIYHVLECHTLNTVANYSTFLPMQYCIIGRAGKTSLEGCQRY